MVRVLTFFALFLAMSIFCLTAKMFAEELQPREELTLGDSSLTVLMPADRIHKEQIHVYSDRATIEISGLRWANFSATGSMLPVLGSVAHALQVIPSSPDEIHPGDIISFWLNNRVIIHRVIEAGVDEYGPYYITKGDNNPEPDPVFVRFEQIDRVVVGILY